MVPERNDVVVVAEGDHSFAVAFGGDEHVRQNLLDAFPQLSPEVVED